MVVCLPGACAHLCVYRLVDPTRVLQKALRLTSNPFIYQTLSSSQSMKFCTAMGPPDKKSARQTIWAARYNAWLLIKVTTNGAFLFFSFSTRQTSKPATINQFINMLSEVMQSNDRPTRTLISMILSCVTSTCANKSSDLYLVLRPTLSSHTVKLSWFMI